MYLSCILCKIVEVEKKGCGGAVWTNLDVTTVIKRNDHMESCPVDEHLAYKMEKRVVLTKRSAEETKPIPAIYDEEASAAFSTLISAIRGYFPNTRVQGCYFHFCKAVYRKVGELGLKTRYRQHEETRRKIRMLLATAFLPVPHFITGVSLLEAGTAGTLAALFQYFRQEWMADERLPLWNVHNVNIRTNNHLEGWHNRLNRKAGKSHNGLYELLQLLIAKQGVMDTLI
ncbi:hypothetical protein T06_7740 [Trichinella sp. T6]|nr:hypothetical protein T06_7740 [Trichinella sp. T6]